MTKHLFFIDTQYVLGSLGLFLVVLIATLSDSADNPRRTFAGHVSGVLARRVIDTVALVGWFRRPAARAGAVMRAPSSA